MRPVQHPTNNSVLSAPPGYTVEECVALPVTRILYDEKHLAIRSFWKPTKEEIDAIVRGEPVCFEIFQTTHAPIALGIYGLTMATSTPLETFE